MTNKRPFRIVLVVLLLVVLASALVLIASTKMSLTLKLLLTAMLAAPVILAQWHAQSTAYRCSVCGEKFRIGALTDFVSPHFPNKKLLRCPSCKVVDWCEEISFESAEHQLRDR